MPIRRRDHDFVNTGKPRLAGSSFSSGIFRDISTGKEWIGKSDQCKSIESSEAIACKEKIASDIYAFYGAVHQELNFLSKRL